MGQHATPTAAYWSFFERFNAKDPEGWAAAMSYPHVRVSAAAPSRQPRTSSGIYPAAADYARMARDAGWERFAATGWVRTQGVTPRVVHRSDTKVHLAGGWTRYRADGSAIISNRVLYALTYMDDDAEAGGGWGIQARFGVDSFTDGDVSVSSEAALAALERTMSTLAAGAVDAWLDCFHFPNVIVLAPGQIERFETREEMDRDYRDWAAQALPIEQTAGVIAAGSSGVLIAQDINHGDASFQQAFLVTERDGRWAVSAVSALVPG